MMRITIFWGLLLGSPDFGKLLFSVTVEGCRMRGSGHRISELGGAYALKKDHAANLRQSSQLIFRV